MSPDNARVLDDEDDDQLELDGLTDAEREALLDDDEDEGAEDDESPSTEEDEEQTEEEDTGDAESDDEADDPQDEAAPVVEDQAPIAVEPVDQGPTYEDRMTEIGTARAALTALYDDGELDTSEYMDKREALQRQETDILFEQREAKIHNDIRQAESTKQWDQANHEFFTSNKDYNDSPGLRAAMQTHYNDVHNDPAFANRSYAARFAEAKSRTDKDLGRGTTKAPAPATNELDAKRQAMKGRGKEAGKVAPGLADIPAAANATPDSGGKFAHLDALEGVDLERALSSLSESEQEAWLAQD